MSSPRPGRQTGFLVGVSCEAMENETAPVESLLDHARSAAYRVSRAVGYGVVGAVAGGLTGLFMRRPTTTRTEKDVVDQLTSNVQFWQFLRGVMPMAENFAREQEYKDRRVLESMGYYPCSRCGIPHEKGGPDADCMPKGTYWDKEKEAYVQPDDEEWSAEGYEAATGEKWDPGPLDDDDEPQVH